VKDFTIAGEEGSHAQAYCIAHGFTFTNMEPDPYPESAHPYGPNTDQTWRWRGHPATKVLRITFDSQTAVHEYGYDQIYIYDGSGKQVGVYTYQSLAARPPL